MKFCKVFLFLTILFLIISGCSFPSIVQPIPTPIVERLEIPNSLYSTLLTIADFKQWLWLNYNYVSDEDWSGFKDYPLTPAEFFMPVIQIGNRIVSKTPMSGDCEDYGALSAFILWKIFNYKAYIAIIPEFSTPNISHMIAFGYGPNNECVVVNAPWVTNRYKSIEAYMAKVYPDKKLTKQTPIEDYLTSLYLEGHHRYWNDELSN